MDRPSARDRRKAERVLRRALYAGQIEPGQYLRRCQLAAQASSRSELHGLVTDVEVDRRLDRRCVAAVAMVALLGVSVVLLAVDFLLLAAGATPGAGLVVPTVVVWALALVTAVPRLAAARRGTRAGFVR